MWLGLFVLDVFVLLLEPLKDGRIWELKGWIGHLQAKNRGPPLCSVVGFFGMFSGGIYLMGEFGTDAFPAVSVSSSYINRFMRLGNTWPTETSARSFSGSFR